MRYQGHIGNDFPMGGGPDPGKWRFWIAVLLLLIATLALLAAAALGLKEGNFNKLQAVYNVAMPIVMIVIGYYFGHSSE